MSAKDNKKGDRGTNILEIGRDRKRFGEIDRQIRVGLMYLIYIIMI